MSDAALAAGRALAESRMVDTCVISAPGEGPPGWDEETGTHVPVEGPVVYDGPCKVQRGALQPRDVEAGDDVLVEDQAQVHLPVAAIGVRVGHLVLVTATAHDPDLVGARLRVDALGHKTWATARRLRCTQEAT